MSALAVAVEAARAAEAILHRARGGALGVRHKGEVDLVTAVDLACEEAVRAVLARHTPDIPVLGEEGGGAEAIATRWVVDPLDGTTNFVHGFPAYAVSVALEVDGEAEVGVVLDAARGPLYAAARGQGATVDGAPLRVSAVSDLSGALVGTGFPYDRRLRADLYLSRLRAVLVRAQGIRRVGAASLDLAMVATGALDAFWEFDLKPWDVAAGNLLVREAGGRVSGHDGGPLDPARPSPLASNGLLHTAMIEALRAAQ
ncbi:MAG: inositol monophosphatase [Deltaproteobacteria bacterium]|nr:inositol monophosphatase [Deltaproteobacteria bacterium]